jgi:hypothetical protein
VINHQVSSFGFGLWALSGAWAGVGRAIQHQATGQLKAHNSNSKLDTGWFAVLVRAPFVCPYCGSARYFGSTSVNPHPFSFRAHAPRFSFDTLISAICTCAGTSFFRYTLSKIVFTDT